MPTKKKDKPDPTDVYVGAAIRKFRMIAGLSQTDLGKALDVSFQQLQKYEKGMNRVSASKLQKIANALHMPVAAFFEGGPDVGSRKAQPDPWGDLLSTKMGVRLCVAFAAISDHSLRTLIVDLCEWGAGQ